MIFVILPHQLFEVRLLPYATEYVLWEHPHYFAAYSYNKKKLLMHRASMQYYKEYLQSKNKKVKYVSWCDKFSITEYTLFDPIDAIKLPGKQCILSNPNFLLDDEACAAYRDKTKKFFFSAFYRWGRARLNVIPNADSTDAQNRERIPADIYIPPIPKLKNNYTRAAAAYVNKHFPKNYGTTDEFNFPVTHREAKRWMWDFIENRLRNFGRYQDSISQSENTLFHSLLSAPLNIGLLSIHDILDAVLVQRVPFNSKEGFVRQLFWRDYQRYCYTYCSFHGNHFGGRRKITSAFYNGTTKITPVDVCIKKAFSTAYLHHIERLMVVGNYMVLYGLHPSEGFKWFMEFSIDSYEWVMTQNVLDMVFYVTGGATMRRPYICSSKYILRMSDYKREAWCEVLDGMYRTFVAKHI